MRDRAGLLRHSRRRGAAAEPSTFVPELRATNTVKTVEPDRDEQLASSPTLVGLAGSLLVPGVRVVQGDLEPDVTTGDPTSTLLGGPDIDCDRV